MESPDCKLWVTGEEPAVLLVGEGEALYETRVYDLNTAQILIASKIRADGMIQAVYRIRAEGEADMLWSDQGWVSIDQYRGMVKEIEAKVQVAPKVIPGIESEFLVSQLVASSGGSSCCLEF